tara:strand:+ start:244 stop:1101 length:858 start_codon:yes stop_codon:yes gene_type:complete
MHTITLDAKIDKTAWQTDDKIWAKQRLQQWKKLSSALRKEGALLPKDVKYYKHYFLTGHIIKDGIEFDFAPTLNAVIFMMFHPDQSAENLLTIYTQYTTVYRKDRCDNSARYFTREIAGHYFGENGILNGNEALYCQILFGDSKAEFAKLHMIKDYTAFRGYCQELIPFLLDSQSYIHHYKQYLTDFYFCTSGKTDYTVTAKVREVNFFLRIIAYYELLDPFKGTDELHYKRAWILVNKVREKLTEPDLPEALLELWESAQTVEGKQQLFEKIEDKYPSLQILSA